MRVLLGVLLLIFSVQSTPLHSEEIHQELKLLDPKNSTIGLNPGLVVDALLNVPQLLKKYGYPVEVHKVQTPDGYILELHRIPKKGGKPVLLVHGFLDSSAGFVLSGPNKALAYILSDLGYDVWMGNCRGNKYSKKHIFLNPSREAFWDFSFHELGTLDVPAMVDFVLLNTGFPKVHYVAHSQGTTALFVMCDQRPGYCDKILSVNAMAPAAYLKHMTSPVMSLLSTFIDQFEFFTKLVGINEFSPTDDFMLSAALLVCKKEAITQPLCTNFMFLFTGFNNDELNKTMVPAILSHIPAGGSTKQFIHLEQLVNSDEFSFFDHGWIKNWFKYGSLTPPSYDISKVTAPVALHYSMNDWIVSTRGVMKIAKLLPNLNGRYLVAIPEFNHMDFLFGMSAKNAVYDQIIKVMKSYE